MSGAFARLGAALLLIPNALACTTIIAGRLATVDGSVLCSHSNDGEGNTDPRLVHIPAQDHPSGSMRPIFYAPETYPRYVGSARGDIPAYASQTPNQIAFKPIGYIPEVAHTYAYHEETYGALNEKQVGIGESTCSGVFGTSAAGHGGQALLSVDTLSQIAMERSDSARHAVSLMGALAEKHGFYGAGSFEGTAESLMVTDPREGFIFHVLPDPTGTSAIWAAMRVPDDHVGVVANAFVIRDLNMSALTPDGLPAFLASPSTFSVAKAKGWWHPSDGLLDFTAVYSDGEYAHKFYSGRRVWGVYKLLAPSLDLPTEYGEYRRDRPYPPTARPDAPVSVAQVAGAMRSYYEGTEFDQTIGLAAGPWGSPDHAYGGSLDGKIKGNWERTIGLWRTSDSHIVQSRSWLPDSVGGVLWWGPHAAPYTAYVPFVAGLSEINTNTLGHAEVMDKATLFWAVRYMANLAQMKWHLAIQDVKGMQADTHTRALDLISNVDAMTSALGAPPTQSELNEIFGQFADSVLSTLWATADAIMFRYADGFINSYNAQGEFSSKPAPYPDWWLNQVGFSKGPPDVPPELEFGHNA